MTNYSYKELSRKFSKLIAKAWLADDSEAKKIDEILREGKSKKLKKLLNKYDIPVFDDCEYLVDRKSFEISVFVDEKTQVTYVRLPYPPQPKDVKDIQLNEWIDNDDPNTVAPADLFLTRFCACLC